MTRPRRSRPPPRAKLLLVPKIEGRYARVGTVAKVEEVGRVRGGAEAVVIRGLHRGVVGVGVPGTGSATWVQIEPIDDGPSRRAPRIRELAREYRATLESIVESRGIPQIAEFLRGIDDPGQIADMAGYSPDLSFERKVEILETVDVEERLEKVLAWAKDTLAEVERQGADPRRGQREPREAPARVDPARADGGDPQGARR